MNRIIKLFIIFVIIIAGTLACDEPLPVKVTSVQSPQVPQTQNKVEPPTIIKQQTPAPAQPPTAPVQSQQPSTPSAQTTQPSINKSLNVPAYLFIEGQQSQNNSNNTLNQTQDPSMEGQVLVLINKARAANGLGVVVRDGVLDSLALQHSLDMVKTNVMSHEGFDARATTSIQTCGAHCVGENVAMGYQHCCIPGSGMARFSRPPAKYYESCFPQDGRRNRRQLCDSDVFRLNTKFL